jgi:outer membrane protein OmpA-like peptidoglycan-associated protein
MSLSRRALALVVGMLLLSNAAWAAQDNGVHDDQDEDECERLNQMKAPTVYGGTGLFNTYSTRTLDAGEFSVGVFWNNFDRDPGDIDINQATVNFSVGLAERWDGWANLIAWQQTTIRNPFLVSGYSYNAINAFGRSPYVFLGPPSGGTNGGAAFFPGTGALGGGILPALGQFGNPIVTTGDTIVDVFGQPGGAIFLGPALVTGAPSYYVDLPFVGQEDFFGFDNNGRPVFGPRQSGNGMGDISLGTKFEIIDPDDNWFSMALGFTVSIPTARNRAALARGRTSGQVDYGPFVAFGQEWADGHWRLYENISYTVSGDPHIGDVKVLDRPDKLGLGVGLSYAPNEHFEFIVEGNSTQYVGGQTPNFNQRGPVDLTVGARWFYLDGRLSFGGAYRRHLNHMDDVTVPALNLQGFRFVPAPPPTVVLEPVFNFTNVRFDGGDSNGFIAYIGFGSRGECAEPPPPNRPPVCTAVTADRSEAIVGESIGLMANASDPDGDVLTYTWTATGGRVVGSGSNVTFDTTGLAPGTYTITAQVDDGFKHVVDCSVSVTVKPRPNQCPTVRLTADKVSVTQGEVVTFTAEATDPDGGPSPISYNWSSSSGSLQGSGNTARLDTTGLEGAITVTVSTSDGDPNCVDTESVTVNVTKIEIPPIVRLCDLFFPRNNARINNEHKACLDDAAIRMQQDPRLVLVVDGHSDKGERKGIAQLRAENARNYLVNEKGIDPNRIVVRSFDDRCPMSDSNQNRRVELNLLPEGRTVDEIQKNCTPQP